MPYFVYQDFLDHWGAQRTAAMIDGDLTKRQLVVGRAAEAAGGLIDAAARTGGFDTPIVPTSISTDPAVQTTLTEMLKLKAIVIATVFSIQPHDDSPRIKDARAECKAWLKGLAVGNGLPVDPPVRQSGFGLTWVGQPGASETFTQFTLRAGRRTAP